MISKQTAPIRETSDFLIDTIRRLNTFWPCVIASHIYLNLEIYKKPYLMELMYIWCYQVKAAWMCLNCQHIIIINILNQSWVKSRFDVCKTSVLHFRIQSNQDMTPQARISLSGLLADRVWPSALQVSEIWGERQAWKQFSWERRAVPRRRRSSHIASCVSSI